MDQGLVEFLEKDVAKVGRRTLDLLTGEIEYATANETARYKLKPLAELFDTSPQAETGSVDWMYERNLALLEVIEMAILMYDDDGENLRDAQIAQTLDRLIANVVAEPGSDVLARGIQFSLRLHLSLNDYSKHEVKMALRKIAKSVDSHSRKCGIRGYIDFLHAVLQQ